MTKNITENINKTGIITKKIISLFIPICLLLISFSLVNCPETDPDTSTDPGNGNGGGQPDVPQQIEVEYRDGVTNKDVVQSGFLLSLRDEPTGDVSVSITISRSDSLDIKLQKGTEPAYETITVPFTKQNWDTPQEIGLSFESNGFPDQAVVKIVFSVTSTADAAYNNLTYIVSGNLTHLDIPEFRIHVHNAQSPEPEGTAGTNDRNMKVWFSIEPSIASTGQAEACAAEGGLWSDPHCVITSINACEKAYGAGTWDSVAATCGSTITAETACLAITGNNWDGTTSTCGSTITAETACLAITGNTWDGTTSTCSITAETACLATTGNTWNSGSDTCQSSGGSYIMARASCEATSGNTWDSGTSTCSSITAEAACTASGNAWNSTTFTCSSITSEAACTASGKNWDSTIDTCASYITAEAACNNIHETWDSANNICNIESERACTDAGVAWNATYEVCGFITAKNACEDSGNTWDDINDLCKDSGSNTIMPETACLATSENVWSNTTSTCGSIGLEDTCAATIYGTWDSANAKCVVMPETTCEEARGVFDSSNSICTIAEDLACDKAEHTWINKAEPVCAITNPQSHDSDITITYTVTDTADTASASAGEDYTAPTTTTATIPASSTSAYTEISLVADLKAVSGVTPDDAGDETFKVSITSVNTLGANLSIADAEATVTIGDPNERSNYFFPNRPLMRGEKAEAATTPTAGDTPSFECYLAAGTEAFSSSLSLIRINNSSVINSLQFNSSSDFGHNVLQLSEYAAETILPLLVHSVDRPFIRMFFDPTGSGYNPINNYSYRCISSFNNGVAVTIKSVPSGRFGMLEFGQAYEYE